jgi:hypothetical protein
LLPPFCMVFSGLSSFLFLRESPMASQAFLPPLCPATNTGHGQPNPGGEGWGWMCSRQAVCLFPVLKQKWDL